MDQVDLKSEAQREMRRKFAGQNNKSFQLILNSVENCCYKSPTFSSFSIRNFKNAITFNPPDTPDERNPASETTFVRNKGLKDSEYLRPKCCNMFSNIYKDRRSAKKLKRYNLIKHIRKPLYYLEEEVPDDCQTVISDEEYDKIPVKIVDEGYVVPDSDSEEDLNAIFVIKKDAESLDEACSGCSTLGQTFTRKVKPKERKEIKAIGIPKSEDPCIETVLCLKMKQKNIRQPKCCI